MSFPERLRKNLTEVFSWVERQSRKRLILLVAALVVLLVFLALIIPKKPAIATAVASRGEFIIDLYTKGDVEALNATNVSVPRMRKHMMLQIVDLVDEGTTVKKGDFLFQLDPSEAQQQVDQARDKLENAKAALASEQASIESNMAQLESQLESQRYSYEQTELNLKMMEFEAEAKRQEARLNLKKAEVSMAQAREKIETQKIIDRATLMRAQLEVRQVEAELKEAEDNLNMLRITAPIGGLVVYKEIWSGGEMKKVQVGDTPFWGMPVIGIPDLSVMMAKTTINEVNVSSVEDGQNAVVTVDALNGKTFYGKISRLAPLARRERGTNRKVFDVEVLLDSTGGELRPGMTCDVRLITGRIENALTVPLQAVFEKEDTTVVYVMGMRGPRKREVQVGRRSNDRIEILAGLEEGEEICLRDPTIPLEELGGEGQGTLPTKPTKPKNRGSSGGGNRMIIVG